MVTERLAFLITASGSDATKEFGKVGHAAEDGLGKANKASSGFGKGMEFVKGHAVAMGAAAGAALVSFGVQAVGAFQDLALEAGTLSDKLGISSESASRWIEVAGDVGVSADSVATSMAKMEKNIGTTPGAFAELGVEISRTNTGAVDANETFIRTLERLKAIKDPTERAAAGTKLLGKSYGDLAEIINGDVRGALASVTNAKVIDEREVAKARALRDAMDELQGKFEDISLEVGSNLVPALVDIAEFGLEAADAIGEVSSFFSDLADDIYDIIPGMDGAGVELGDLAEKLEKLYKPVQTNAERWTALGDSFLSTEKAAMSTAEEIATLEEETANLVSTVNSAISSDLGYQAALNSTEDAVIELFGKVQELNKAQGDDRAAVLEEVQRSELALLGTYVAQSEAAVKLWEDNAALSGATLTAADSARIQRAELVKLQETTSPGSTLYNSLQGYIDKLDAIPGVVKTQAEIDTAEAEGKIAELRRQIGALAVYTGTARSGYMDPKYQGLGPGRANGGPTSPGTVYPIVERGTPELLTEGGQTYLIPGSNGMVTPLSAAGSGMGGSPVNIYLTVQAGMLGQDVPRMAVEALALAVKQMGAKTVQKAIGL